jgi:hypothetical protein
LSRSQIQKGIHQVLQARVGLLLGQTTFEELLPLQERVSLELARGALLWHGKQPHEGAQELAQAMVDALGLDPLFYSASSLDFLISEGLTSASLALADAVRGHERDSFEQWQQEVVPQLDRIAEFVVSVFDGRWRSAQAGMSLTQALAQARR